jgi:small subunit ribosomal protein S18
MAYGGGQRGGRRRKGYAKFPTRRRCRFCREKVKQIDYKDTQTLEKLCTNQGKVFSRKRSGNCARHQRQAKIAIKRARYMALLSYTG